MQSAAADMDDVNPSPKLPPETPPASSAQLLQSNRELLDLNDKLVQARDYANAIVQTVREPLLVLSASLHIISANASFYRVFNSTPQATEQCLIYDLGNGQWDIPALRSLLGDLLSQRSEVRDFEVTHHFPGGIGHKTMLLNATKLVWADHSLILLAIEDITERHAAFEQLRVVDRRKDEFLTMAAHELRGPLAPMRNAIAVLQTSPVESADALQARSILERQVHKMTRIVEDLLDMAHLGRGHIRLQTQTLNLCAALRDAAAAAQSRFDERRLSLEVSLPDSGVMVDGDPARLDQVFSNLLTNAAKYTEPGGLIRLSLVREANEAVIRISDNGIGISPELLPSIFDLFMQEPRSRARSQGGLGIGLTVVRQITELHGGRVEAASAGLNQGSEFIVWLRTLDRQASVSAAMLDEPALFVPRRILVVDDNADAADACALLLKLQGHETVTVGDGYSALEAVKTFVPDIVLLDIGLPGMDGYEVARRLRESLQTRTIQLIALSGYGGEDDRRQTMAAGFDHHLVKPTAPGQLNAMIAAYATT